MTLEAQPKLQELMRRYKAVKKLGDDYENSALDAIQNPKLAAFDKKSSALLLTVDSLGRVPDGAEPDCAKLEQLKSAAAELNTVIKAKSDYMLQRLDEKIAEAEKSAAPAKPEAKAETKKKTDGGANAASGAENEGCRPAQLLERVLDDARQVRRDRSEEAARRVTIFSIVKPSSSGGGSIAFASGCFIATSDSAYVSFGFVFADQFCDGRGDGFAGGGCGRRRSHYPRRRSRGRLGPFLGLGFGFGLCWSRAFFSLRDFFVEALQDVIRLRLDHGVEFGSGGFQLFELGAVGFSAVRDAAKRVDGQEQGTTLLVEGGELRVLDRVQSRVLVVVAKLFHGLVAAHEFLQLGLRLERHGTQARTRLVDGGGKILGRAGRGMKCR